ncbi:Endonuclease III [hydrothermal vent metagenome]|uniref:Endonuclease III n=1 Tax=hydrothermal vent metagenome TaxID=652676 RepID=A0A3B1D822_9ZZZZ
MDNRKISTVLQKIKQAGVSWKTPAVVHIGKSKDPFRVLISCILSLRTRDEVTEVASNRLFALADNPQKILSLEARRKSSKRNQKASPGVSKLALAKASEIEKAIYPVAFYRKKAQTLIEISQELVEHHNAEVPDTLDELLKLKGVGRKTANLTLILGHGKMGICVDTHVHRISNRLGYVNTSSPDATEIALCDQLPKNYWMQLNELLVLFGQNICKPISPLCSQCCVSDQCEKTGVGDKHR